MRTLLIWFGVLLLGAVIGAGVLWFGVRGRLTGRKTEAAEEEKKSSEESSRVAYTPGGELLVHLDAQTQTYAGVKVAPLVAISHQPEIVAYGELQEDPQRSFTLRAPVAGVITTAAAPWLSLDQRLAADDLIGYLDPRLTPTEQIDLAARLTQAKADVVEAEAALTTARLSYENKKKLNAESKAVSDRSLEEAEAKFKSDEARFKAATDIVHMIEAARSAGSGTTTRLELRAARAGHVIESLVQPGEAVEAGQVLLRLADFTDLVARVQVPIGTRFDESALAVQIVPVGQDDVILKGQRLGLGSAATPADRGLILLFRVPTAGHPLRPGTPVAAYLPLPGGPQSGVSVPRSAVIRSQGRPWVYIRVEEEGFVRRELVQAEPTEAGWFASAGLTEGDMIVVDGAQMLLSEEQKSQIEQEAAATE